MEFSKQEYWNGLPFPSPEDLPDPGIKPRSPTLQANSLPPEPPGKPQGRGTQLLTLVSPAGGSLDRQLCPLRWTEVLMAIPPPFQRA